MERFGLSASSIKYINDIFPQFPHVEKVLIYGSRAMNTNRDNSDIDLVIQGEQVNLTELLEIKTALDDLLIPYKIDLSLFHQIDNPNLTAHIRRVGQVFYCRK